MIGEMTSRQIVALANEGLDCGSIARELNVEVSLVKLVLSANLPQDSSPERDLDDNDLVELRHNAKRLALCAEDESVQARMTMFLIERDKPRKIADSGPNIGNINIAIMQSREKFMELTEKYAKIPAES